MTGCVAFRKVEERHLRAVFRGPKSRVFRERCSEGPSLVCSDSGVQRAQVLCVLIAAFRGLKSRVF
jgi:hypothetical protein